MSTLTKRYAHTNPRMLTSEHPHKRFERVAMHQPHTDMNENLNYPFFFCLKPKHLENVIQVN